MALDEPKDNDFKHEADSVTFVIDNQLLEKVKGVKVDFLDQGWRQGFSILPEEPPAPSGPSSCSTCSSC